MTMVEFNHHTVRSEKIARSLTLAVVSDLHNGPYEHLMSELRKADGILILGDLVNRHRHGYESAVDFLQAAPEIAPTFYAIGNHEWKFPQRDEYWPHVEKSSAVVLDNTFTLFEGIVLGGFSSAPKGKEKPAFLRDMVAQPGFKLLMCHHPEMYAPHVAGHDIDLTLAGHAHGGQVRLGGQGLYSPGQGWLPKLTAGWYFDDRLLVSRGAYNSTWAPRLWNPCEVIMLHLEPA